METNNIEKNLENLDNLIKQKELKEQLQELDEYKTIYQKLEKLIIKNKLVIYGGYALNELLPKKAKIYDENELPDYDIYIPLLSNNNDTTITSKENKNIKEIMINIIKMIENFKKDNITSLQQGHNPGTLKLFVNYTGILDLSFINPHIYKLHLYIYNTEKYKINKNLNKKFVINPLYLKMAFYQELGKEGSYFRWLKLYKRLHQFDNNYFNELFLNPKKDKFLTNKINLQHVYNTTLIKMRNEVINFCKNKNLVVSGIYTYIKYILDNNIQDKIFTNDILETLNYKKLFTFDCQNYLNILIYFIANDNNLIEQLELFLLKKIKNINDNYKIEIIDNTNNLFGFNSMQFNLRNKKERIHIFNLIKIDNEKQLYRKKNNIKYISEHGLIRFLYLNLMNNYRNIELRQFYYQLIYNLEKVVKTKYKGKIKEIFDLPHLGEELNIKMRKKIGMITNNISHKEKLINFRSKK